jgi:ribosomal protein S27AE
VEIWHRITFGHRDGVDAEIEAMHIQYKKSPLPGTGYLIHIDVSESDSRWPQLAALVRQKNALDVCNTTFTPAEILSAQWARLVPAFEQGYPQPEATWVRKPVNYEEHCPRCGTFRQAASFRLKKEPVLGKKVFMSLYWTYALFCARVVLIQLEADEIRGYEVWDALIHKTNTPSESLSQLFIPAIAKPGLVRVEDLKRETCPECGMTRYYPHMRGVMHLKRDALSSDSDIMQSYEWFGDGHMAYREILVSHKLAKLVLDKGWQGIVLKAVDLV